MMNPRFYTTSYDKRKDSNLTLLSFLQTVDKVGVGIYSQHHFSLYNQYFDSFLKI